MDTSVLSSVIDRKVRRNVPRTTASLFPPCEKDLSKAAFLIPKRYAMTIIAKTRHFPLNNTFFIPRSTC